MIIGIQRSTQIGHIARAALESIAFQVADVLAGHGAEFGADPSANCAWTAAPQHYEVLMQLQADLLQRPVWRPAVLESIAMGTALLGWVVGQPLEQHGRGRMAARAEHDLRGCRCPLRHEGPQVTLRNAAKSAAVWNTRASGGYAGKSEDPPTR
jgi:ribulose kinase